jgi:hypothetical protein
MLQPAAPPPGPATPNQALVSIALASVVKELSGIKKRVADIKESSQAELSSPLLQTQAAESFTASTPMDSETKATIEPQHFAAAQKQDKHRQNKEANLWAMQSGQQDETKMQAIRLAQQDEAKKAAAKRSERQHMEAQLRARTEIAAQLAAESEHIKANRARDAFIEAEAYDARQRASVAQSEIEQQQEKLNARMALNKVLKAEGDAKTKRDQIRALQEKEDNRNMNALLLEATSEAHEQAMQKRAEQERKHSFKAKHDAIQRRKEAEAVVAASEDRRVAAAKARWSRERHNYISKLLVDTSLAQDQAQNTITRIKKTLALQDADNVRIQEAKAMKAHIQAAKALITETADEDVADERAALAKGEEEIANGEAKAAHDAVEGVDASVRYDQDVVYEKERLLKEANALHAIRSAHEADEIPQPLASSPVVRSARNQVLEVLGFA